MSARKKFIRFITATIITISIIFLLPWITIGTYYFLFQCDKSFIEAVEKEDIATVKRYLARWKNPNCIDMDLKNQRTPLSVAASKDNAEIVNILIDAGAKPEKTLMGLFSVGSKPASEILIKRAKLKQKELNILLVGYSKSPNMMRHLIKRGADVNIRISPKGWIKRDTTTPLYQASYNTGRAEYSYPEGVKFLLENDADPNLPGYEGNLPIGAAAINRNPEIIKALIEAGADINRESACGFPPLIIAAAWGFSTNVTILLDVGADPNTRDNRSRANEACYNDRLMGQKRSPRLNQETADHRRKILGIKDEGNIREAYESQRPERAAAFANRAIDGPYDGTAIMWAAYACDPDSVELLLDKGADVNARDAYDATALMWGYGCKAVVPLLLKAGADPGAKDAGGKTAKEYLPGLH